MFQNGGDASRVSPPGRPRHQITRSISEISSPIRLNRHHSYRATKTSEAESRTLDPQSSIQSAVQERRSFEWPRSEGATPNISPNPSRRTSILSPSADEVMPAAPVKSRDNGLVKELVKEQQRAVARESGLQRSLAELETFASSTTKQLDDTYYSVLAKLNSLQSTISALKELAELSQQLNSDIDTEAEELVTEVSSQLDAFGQFEDQQKRIESLQSRIQTGRELIRALSERVDAVSKRIESWERADREWQEKTRRRLKAFWVVTSVVIFLVLSLLVGAQYAPENLEGTPVATESLKTITGEISDALNNTATTGTPSLLTAEMFRAFDEL